MKSLLSRFVLCYCLLALPVAFADVKIRPGDKSSSSTKEFIKDRKKNGYATPEPIDRTFGFTTGMSVEVVLQVATSFLGSVKFTIRDQPQHGKLSEIRSFPGGESNKVVVTYTHNGDPDQVSDRFTFQAKIGDGISSAPGIITLLGKRAAPRLEVIEPAKFKRLQPGETDTGIVMVMNTGTAPFSSEISWPPPFIGPPKLELAVNEKQTFMLAITPPATGAYRLSQELQPGVEASRVQAYVECVQPYAITPSTMALTFNAAKGDRSGTIKISNASSAPLKLRVEAPNRIQVQREVTVPPISSMNLLLAMDAKDVEAFHGEVWIVQDPHREKVAVRADPEPPQIRLQNPAQSTINFGRVEKGTPAEVRVFVTNDGGQDAILKATYMPPFRLEGAGDRGMVVEPGKTQQLVLRFAPEQPGNFSGELSIGGNAGRINLSAQGYLLDPKRPGRSVSIENPNVLPSSRNTTGPATTKTRESATRPKVAASSPAPVTPVSLSKPPPSAPAPLPPAVETKTADAGGAEVPTGSMGASLQKMGSRAHALYGHLATYGMGVEMLPEFKSNILEPVPVIGVSDAGRDYLVLNWTSPKVEPKQYLIQTSRYVLNKATGLPMKTWVNVDGWKPVTMPAGSAAARIDGLQPSTEYEWRVLGVDREGKLSPASALLRVITLPPLTIPGWVWQLATAGLAVIILLTIRRMREQRAAA